ncbi:MAG: DUF1116 domain-containing protein [Alphaproteobacteria bacterium]
MMPADRHALEKLLAVRPAWAGVPLAADAVGLEGATLLHCGPPADPPHDLVRPTVHSAAVACVFEGWASNFDEADALIASGDVRFEPEQNRNVATPMAAVVSPSMRLLKFVDLDDPGRRAFAPLNGGGTGAAPAPRYGRKTMEALDLVRFLNDEVADAIAPASAEPIPWLPIIDDALIGGDDGHLRHLAAHGMLVAMLRERLGSGFAGGRSDAFIAEWPIFHLNFWMAGSRCVLAAAAGVEGSSIITAFGGNGDRFGLQVGGLPGRWFTVEATPPRGRLRPPHTPASCVGAYGDSALAEALGLGAMAQSYCPDMQALHKDFTPGDILELPAKLLMGAHPALPKSRARVGLSARAVVEAGITPVVELGIVDAAGLDGGLGAGIYRPPIAPFVAACAALDGG